MAGAAAQAVGVAIFAACWLAALAIQEELFQAAARAKDGNGTLITVAGDAAALLHYLPIYLQAVRLAGSEHMESHLVVVATTELAHSVCLQLHDKCVLDDWASSLGGAQLQVVAAGGGLAGFATPAFLSVQFRRHELVRDLVHAGFNVVSTDLDVVTLRDYLRGNVLPFASGDDFLLSKERDAAQDGEGNSGFYFIRSSEASKALMSAWVAAEFREGHGHDQNVLNEVLGARGNEFGLRWRLLPRSTGLNACGRQYEDSTEFVLNRIIDYENSQTQLAFFHCACFYSQSIGRRIHGMQTLLAYVATRRIGLARMDFPM